MIMIPTLYVNCMYGEERVAPSRHWLGVPRIGDGVAGDDGVQYWVKGVYWSLPSRLGQHVKLVLTANAPLIEC